MTLWSDFLHRLMLGAGLSSPAATAAAEEPEAARPLAEDGEAQPECQAADRPAGAAASPAG